MWTKKVNGIVEVYRNTNLKHPFEIVDNFSCKIPLKHTSSITSIKLFFGTYKKVCSGNLLIKVAVEDPHTGALYSIHMSDIQDNIPIELLFDKPLTVKKEVSIVLRAEYNKNNRLAIWMNPGGICAIVTGEVKKEYNLKYSPKISIITPIYKTKLNFIKKTIESVQAQLYDNWELILIDDASKDGRITKFINSCKTDKRIKVLVNRVNYGISVATNIGIKKASGEYTAFLDHDDLLEEDALVKVVSYLNDHPDTDLLYTDEDKVTETGEYYGPFYKSDWNYSMLLSHMYTCHLSVYRSEILNRIGGIREGYDGSQDYDLVLRFIEETRKIGHIPEILYHWRACEGSTAQGIQNKPKARINAVRAISEHLERIGKKAKVYAGPFQGHYHVDYKLEKEPLVSIVIPFKDNINYLETLLFTMKLTEYKNYEIILVSNLSVEEETREFISEVQHDNRIKVLFYEKPFNFSAINNFAVKSKLCKGDLVLFLNNDMEVMHPEWLTELVKQFILENVKVVGGKLLYLNHQIQHAGVFVGVNGVAGHLHKKMFDNMPGYFSRPHIVQEITAVTGACMMVNKKLFKELGGFDESLPKAFNDIDLCLRVREKGHLIIYTPYCRLYHLESMSRGLDDMHNPEFQNSIRKMEKKWDVLNFKDPYYNPNLPLNCEGARWV